MFTFVLPGTNKCFFYLTRFREGLFFRPNGERRLARLSLDSFFIPDESIPTATFVFLSHVLSREREREISCKERCA